MMGGEGEGDSALLFVWKTDARFVVVKFMTRRSNV
jgi:hypothetical protein